MFFWALFDGDNLFEDITNDMMQGSVPWAQSGLIFATEELATACADYYRSLDCVDEVLEVRKMQAV